MDTPTEGKPTADADARKVRPEVEGFVERVVVPALVNRYIKKLKEGKNPLTTGSGAGPVYLRGNKARVREILAAVKPLAAEYYRLTGKPLGVTGELAEYVAAEILGVKLVAARTVGYDALRGTERIQIKGRAYGENAKPGQRISRIKLDAPCDTVLLVLLDNATLEPREMWEAPFASVRECLARPGSKARARGALSVSAFKRLPLVRCVWPS